MLAALEQAYWQRWNRPISSAGIALLAALEQAHWQRWNSSTGSAGTALLAALEQAYWQRWNSSTGNNNRIATLGNSLENKFLDRSPKDLT